MFQIMLQLVGIKNALSRKTKDKQSENTLKALFDISSMKQHLSEMHSTLDNPFVSCPYFKNLSIR